MPGGKRGDMPYINFYLDYFAQGKPAYVPISYMSYNESVQMIKDNGGTPVVAHPGLNFKDNEAIVEQLIQKGASGLEVFNNYHNTAQISYFSSIVIQKNAIMTVGSDFHGKTKPLIKMGEYTYDNTYNDYFTRSMEQLIAL